MARTMGRAWYRALTFTAASQDTARPWPLLLSGSTAHAWLPRNRARDTYQEARGKLGLGGRAGEQGDGAPLLQKEHKTLQLPAARNFGFCFQASTSGKLPRGGDMDCSLR